MLATCQWINRQRRSGFDLQSSRRAHKLKWLEQQQTIFRSCDCNAIGHFYKTSRSKRDIVSLTGKRQDTDRVVLESYIRSAAEVRFVHISKVVTRILR
jgi:hypothetical protein